LTDTLPSGLGTPTVLAWDGTTVAPVYDRATHRITWSAAPTAGQPVTLTYSAPIDVVTPTALINRAVLIGTDGIVRDASATVIAYPYRIALPLVLNRD